MSKQGGIQDDAPWLQQPKVFAFTPYGPFFYAKELTLGEDWMVRMFGKWRLCRVVKVTRKGFNLLDIATSKCILRRHLYAKGYGGKPIPPNKKTFKFNIPEWVVFGDKVGMEDIG